MASSLRSGFPGRVFSFCACLVLFAGCGIGVAGPRLQLILTDAASVDELRSIARTLEDQGARVRHFFPPDAALGEVPLNLEPSQMPALDGKVQILREPGPESDALAPAAGGRFFAPWARLHGVWERLYESRPMGAGAPFAFDALLPGEGDVPAPGMAEAALPCTPAGWTSAYLLGDVSIGILLMESTSSDPAENTEDWTVTRQDEVIAEIAEAADQLAVIYPDAGLDFFYDIKRDLPTDVEPIARSSGERSNWISDALQTLGYAGVRQYIRSVRDAHGTDWSLAAFVVDSLNDGDGKFTDGLFAFAYLGGPYMVMTYDNDGWGIGRMDTVFSHEMGHNFYALDEYASANKACDLRSGLLRVENQNSAVGGCLSSDACLMRANSFPDAYCSWSRGQLGLRDSDSNGIPDLRDTDPQTSLDPVEPNPSPIADVTVTGLASAFPDPGEVSFSAAHTLNTIVGVEYRLDGAGWLPADPVDGPFDERCEPFSVSLSALAEGWHQVETRGIAAVCDADDVEICSPPVLRAEQSYPSAMVYVNTDCAEDPYEPNDAPGEETLIPAGALEGLQLCAFDPDRYSLFLRKDATLDARVEYTDPAALVTLELFSPRSVSLERMEGSGGVAAVSMAAAPETGWYTLAVTGEGESETPYRLVVDASCIDDAMEPNAAASSAPALAQGLTGNLQLCKGDEDWYRVSVSDLIDVDVELNHTSALGNLDLFFYAPDMTLLASSQSALDQETVNLTALPEEVYHLLVRGASADEQNQYDLTLTATGCLDDLGENNDTRAGAAPAQDHVDGRICPGDEDWFRVDVDETSFLRVELLYPQVQGDLDLEIRNSADVVLGRSTGQTGVELLDMERLAQGAYYVRVFGPDPVENVYQLDVRLADPLLLFAVHQGNNVILEWNDAGIECYWLRRAQIKQTFDGGFETVIDITAGGGDETGFDATGYGDLDILTDGTPYFYKVNPTACRGTLLTVTKTVEPYPIYERNPVMTNPSYTITITNEGREPATSIVLYDDIPSGIFWFAVQEIPAGATDNSSPTGGAFGSGYVQIEGFSLNPGESAVVRFEIGMQNSTGSNALVVRNQARVKAWNGTGGAIDVLSDDPSTYAPFDSTDFLPRMYWYSLLVTAFWNQDVDVDLRVVDPCGNLIGPADLWSAECPAGTPGASVWTAGGCGDPWPWGWAEAVSHSGSDAPAPGTYEVWLRYTDHRDAPASTCLHGGLEDVVVAVEKLKDFSYEWIVLDPDETDWVLATTFEIP